MLFPMPLALSFAVPFAILSLGLFSDYLGGGGGLSGCRRRRMYLCIIRYLGYKYSCVFLICLFLR